jgi:hypothetical protein
MRVVNLAQSWRKVGEVAAIQSQLRAAGSAPTQGGGVR